MANYDSLINAVKAAVKTNGTGAITGATLQATLLGTIEDLTVGFQFMGVATPETTPDSNDKKEFYLGFAGTYANFGSSVTVPEGSVIVFKKDNSAWSSQVIKIVDPVSVSRNTNTGGYDLTVGDKTITEIIGKSVYSNYPIATLTNAIDEIYLDKYSEGLKLDALVWNGSNLTLLIIDSDNNNVAYINNIPASAGKVITFKSVSGASIELNGYIILTSETCSFTQISSTLLPDVYDIRKSKKILAYLSDGVFQQLHPSYTNRKALNPIFKELYINGYKDGYYMSYCIWTGAKVTIIIRDSSENILLFANNLDATAGQVFSHTQNGITLYAIFTNSTYLTSPQNTNFEDGALNIKFNPEIFDYIVNSKSDMEYPINVSRFDQGGTLPAGHKASWITISRRMDDEFDSVFNFANKTYPNLTNKWFDFYAVGKHARGTDGVSKCNTYIDWTGINGLSTSDALMMAVIVGAVNNIDGDNTTIKWHTGGAHAYGDSATGATPTMRELSNTVMADGKIVPVGRLNVKCKKLTIDVVNNIQGYNTCKEDGTGREILQQRYHIECTNEHIDVYCELVALEDVILYGANVATGMNVTNMQYRFIGSKSKRGLYTYNGANVPDNDDNKINSFCIINDGYEFDVEYDLDYGVGNKLMDSYNCFVTTAAKSYFMNIAESEQIALSANELVNWKIRLRVRKQ